MPTLDFASLIPTRNAFRYEGQVYEFRSKVDFGAVDFARLSRLQREIQEALKALEASGEDEAAALTLERVIGEFITLILPDLPGEAFAAMTLGQKMGINEWWGEQEDRAEAASPPDASPAAAKAIPAAPDEADPEAGKSAAR